MLTEASSKVTSASTVSSSMMQSMLAPAHLLGTTAVKASQAEPQTMVLMKNSEWKDVMRSAAASKDASSTIALASNSTASMTNTPIRLSGQAVSGPLSTPITSRTRTTTRTATKVSRQVSHTPSSGETSTCMLQPTFSIPLAIWMFAVRSTMKIICTAKVTQ